MTIPKEIQALERLKNTLLAEGYWQDVLEDVSIIENALNNYYRLLKEDDETTKKLKALEIIKKKYLDPHDFVLCYYTMNNEKWIDYEEYKKAYLNYYENDEYMLTQEEYDLLKEVML